MGAADLAVGGGLIAVFVGISLIYFPAALVVGGAGLVLFGVLAEQRRENR